MDKIRDKKWIEDDENNFEGRKKRRGGEEKRRKRRDEKVGKNERFIKTRKGESGVTEITHSFFSFLAISFFG